MIQFLNPSNKDYTNRDYLLRWLRRDILVLTDNDLENVTETQVLLVNKSGPRVLDITHNPIRTWNQNFHVDLVLENDIELFYNPQPQRRFLPLFLWMFSRRDPLWWQHLVFDADADKSLPMMCLNNQRREHRTWLYELMQPVVPRMIYSINGQGLADEQSQTGFNDVSVAHPAYARCAVNLVTETVISYGYISEKTCKPFMAQQIPLLLAGPGINTFLENVGLDMFSDLIPWHSWDDCEDPRQRVNAIADFAQSWLNSGKILDDYSRVRDRVERNKQWFHSQEFQDRLTVQLNSGLLP